MSITRFSFNQQWGHIGSELGRAISRKKHNDEVAYKNSLERALSMLDEMIADHIFKHNLKEITRFREFLCGIYLHASEVNIQLNDLENYCNQFAFAEYGLNKNS